MKNIKNKLNSIKNIVLGESSQHYVDHKWFVDEQLDFIPVNMVWEDVEIKDEDDYSNFCYPLSMIGHQNQLENIQTYQNTQAKLERSNAFNMNDEYQVSFIALN